MIDRLGVALAAASLLLLSCGTDAEQHAEAPAAPVVGASAWQAAATEVFGDAVVATEVVATVGSTTITAGEVAAYLRLFPTLSVDQAVEDLIDISIAATLPPAEAPFDAVDARIRGRALTWLRAHLFDDPAVSRPDAARVAELRDDPASLTKYATPPLAVASQVLFYCEAANQTPERREAAESLSRRIVAAAAALGRPVTPTDLFVVADRVIAEDGPLPDGVTLERNIDLRFPRRYAGPARWLGIEAVVDSFGDAAFDAPIGTVVGPITTEFGWHTLVTTQRTELDPATPEGLAAALDATVVREQRSRLLAAFIRDQLRAVPVLMYEDNMRLVTMPAEERARLEAEEWGERFR